MNNISWRHHYIPQFYLKGFTSENGAFKIYSVDKKDFIKGGKDFFPESYFFEEDANTLSFDGKLKFDFQERNYQKLDDNASEIFSRINKANSSTKFDINDRDIAYLQYFIGVLYWRNPSNYDEIKYLLERKTLKQIGLVISDKDGKTDDDMEYENKIKSNPSFFKSMKYWFPLISYRENIECHTPLNIIEFPSGLPKLCSDNPIVSRFPDTFRVYTDDLIFPLNSTKIFVRGKRQGNLLTSIKIEIDLLVYKQAKKYVCCTQPSYLEKLDWLYERRYKSLDAIRHSLFKQLISYAA